MAYTANVTINADTDTVRLVTDPEPRGFVVDLLDVNGAVISTKIGTDLTYAFENLSAGSYSVRAVLNDTAGDDDTVEFSVVPKTVLTIPSR